MPLVPSPLSRAVRCLAGAALLAISFASPAAAESSAWYVAVGLGADSASTVEHSGSNRDNLCYPDDDCSHLPGGRPEGYRWHYDLDTETGALLELAVGRGFGPLRLELAATQFTNDTDEHTYTGGGYLGGSPRRSADNDIRSGGMAGVDGLRTRAVSINAYYDFAQFGERFTPYLGVGLGLAEVEVSDLFYRSDYRGTQPPSGPPLSFYNSNQLVSFDDTSLSRHLYAGADYRLNDQFLLGLKLAYVRVGNIESRNGYLVHPIADATNVTKISGMDHWSLAVTLKYRFGG